MRSFKLGGDRVDPSIGARRSPRLVAVCAAAVLWALSVFPGIRVAGAQESQLDACRAASRASPGDGAASLALGRALRRAGRVGEALAELHRGLAVAGGRPDTAAALHWEVARAYADQHDLPRAVASCRELERKRITGPETIPTPASHACVATAYLSWQRATEALAEAGQALDKDPAQYDAEVAQGRAYELELKPGDAEAAFRAALATRPDAEEAHLALGDVLVREGKRDEGLAELHRALLLDPADPEGLYTLAEALPPGPESTALLERATRERASFADAWLALGRQQFDAGDLPSARASAEAALKSDATNVGALVLSGKVALALGQPDDALRAGRAVLKIESNHAAAVLLVADASAKKGEIDEALEAYQTAWGLDHGNPAPLVHASRACHAAQRDTSARAFGAKAAQEFPNWAPAWDALGDALVGQKEVSAARDAYRKALGVPDGVVDRAAVAQKLAALK